MDNYIIQTTFYLACVLLLVKPLGLYIANVYEGKSHFLQPLLRPIELSIYRFSRVRFDKEMDWKEYALALLIFNIFCIFMVYFLQRFQSFFPLNPQHFSSVTPDLAFNTATSFVTNTNWQAYSGESSLSYFTQMVGLTSQNFFSAAAGISVLMAFTRGLKRRETTQLGNFWVDTVRGILYILLPLSLVLALLLVSQGVIQNFKDYQKADLIQNLHYSTGSDSNNQTIHIQNEQLIPMGPVASQVAIKQLGTNGGGYFNTNSSHPFENPTPFSNFLEMLAILLIPAALCYTFGVMVEDVRQGWAILSVMLIVLIPCMIGATLIEQSSNSELIKAINPNHLQMTENMEGKEVRFGSLNSSLWIAAATATGNGSVNAMIDSFLPISGLIPLVLINLGEVIFGGIGSGLYQMLIFIIVTVFISGLMVGRTPEYLGKKIEPYEIKMVSFIILIMPLTVLSFTAIAVTTDIGKSALGNPGTHGFTEILYAFSSMANNNGSAFAGLNANTVFYNLLGGIAMLIGRYWIAIPTLAVAGSLAKKKNVPASSGTLPTHNFLFIFVLISVILIFGVLTFFPAYALGPIMEQLNMLGI